MTKMKIALAAVLFATTGSAAFAQFDPDLSNRYPGYAGPNTYGYSTAGKLGALEAPTAAMHSAPVRLPKRGNDRLQPGAVLQHRNVALPTGAAASPDWFAIEQLDRASSPYAGGN